MNASTYLDFSYILIKPRQNQILDDYEEVEINFQQKTKIYENSFSDRFILFSQINPLSENIYSYNITEGCLKREFSRKTIENKANEQYFYKTIWTDADDKGIKIPVSLLWKNNTFEPLTQNKSCVINVYGAYGKDDSIQPDPLILSMIEAGFLYAVVHVRGGGFLGGEWYRAGRGDSKWNSINDPSLVSII